MENIRGGNSLKRDFEKSVKCVVS